MTHPLKFPGLLLTLLALTLTVSGQDDWPRSIITADGRIIRVFYPQPDSLVDNNLQFRAAFSMMKKGATELVFGSFRAWSVIGTDRNSRMLSLSASNIIDLRLESPTSPDSIAALRETIECGLPGIGADISIDRLIALLDHPAHPRNLSRGLAVTPPRIIFWGRPAVLAFMDGIPRFKWDRDYALYVVANSPHTIMESSDGWFYTYGGRHWYIAPSPEGPWQHTTYIAPDLHHVEALINSINDREAEHPDTLREGNDGVVDVIFSTRPAELICTKGPPHFEPISGTTLFYATNTNNDLFLDSLQHRYYLLISGRWFSAPGLTGNWTSVPQDALPGEFRTIPEGSPADRVLACVAGTRPAIEALIDAGIPQTAIIDRRKATTHVSYDGAPKFLPIRGTRFQYVCNTTSEVLLDGKTFYCVDKGVWFSSPAAAGPWTACTSLPEDIAKIPPDCPLYHCKYVYIYGVTGDMISTGYTPGYLGSYNDGESVVYGTGYYYPSYTDNIVIPRPWTYGFNMWYNPWFGWTLGYDYSLDWLNTAMAWGEGYWTGGWFGPPDYRPPYIWHHFSGHGLYAKNYRLQSPGSYNNNLYTLRNDLVRGPQPDFTVTDTGLNIYCWNEDHGWLLRNSGSWVAMDKSQSQALLYLDQLRKNLYRGEMRARNFRQAANPSIVSPAQKPGHGKTAE